MSGQELDKVHYSDWLALFGYIPEAEALRIAQLPGETPDLTSTRLADAIRRAHDYTSKIRGRSGLKPKVRKLGAQFSERVSKLREEPTFAEHLIGVSASDFEWIELKRLKAFQPLLNLEYVDSLVASAPEPSDERSTVEFCLPLRSERKKAEVLSAFNPNMNTFIISTGNLDMRIVGQFSSEDPATGRRLLGFAYDFGLPQISVIEYKSNYFVKNGYHRAFALLKKGHEYLPCLSLRTESFQSTGAQQPGFLPVDVVLSDAAPLLSDFLTDAAVTIPRRRVRATISIHGELQIVGM